MANILSGKKTSEHLDQVTTEKVNALKEKGITPTLAIVRCGERPDDLSYERGATKRADKLGVAIKQVLLPEDVTKEALIQTIEDLNNDAEVNGVLMFRPLPKHLKADENEIVNRLVPGKDVDGMTDLSMAGVFLGKPNGYAPCTPSACMEILHYYDIPVKGKKVTVIGRSPVVGKPLAMLLMNEHATVTVCHTRTVDVPGTAKDAEILVSAAGVLKSVDASYLSAGQTVIDVSINWDEEKGGIAGDVCFDQADEIVESITPVPGGVGAVTVSILMSHVVDACEKQNA